jgi:hypothetical protein
MDIIDSSNYSNGISSSGPMQEAPNYKWENERLLLKVIKKQLNISDEDMRSPSIVKAKLREYNIDKLLED